MSGPLWDTNSGIGRPRSAVQIPGHVPAVPGLAPVPGELAVEPENGHDEDNSVQEALPDPEAAMLSKDALHLINAVTVWTAQDATPLATKRREEIVLETISKRLKPQR